MALLVRLTKVEGLVFLAHGNVSDIGYVGWLRGLLDRVVINVASPTCEPCMERSKKRGKVIDRGQGDIGYMSQSSSQCQVIV